MKKYITKGDGLPAWSAPISHAAVARNTCYLSGHLSLGADGQYLPGTGREEAQRAFRNLANVLEASGFFSKTWSNAVRFALRRAHQGARRGGTGSGF